MKKQSVLSWWLFFLRFVIPTETTLQFYIVPLQKHDDPIQLSRHLDLGSYAPYVDDEFRQLTNFPQTPFTIYDTFRGCFFPIVTWSRYDIHDDAPIII
jgi:hypothetical protein